MQLDRSMLPEVPLEAASGHPGLLPRKTDQWPHDAKPRGLFIPVMGLLPGQSFSRKPRRGQDNKGNGHLGYLISGWFVRRAASRRKGLDGTLQAARCRHKARDTWPDTWPDGAKRRGPFSCSPATPSASSSGMFSPHAPFSLLLTLATLDLSTPHHGQVASLAG